MNPETYEQQLDRERIENAKSRKATRAKLCEVFKLLGFTPESKQQDPDTYGPGVWLSATQDDMTLFAQANTYNTKGGRVIFSVFYPKPKQGESYDREWPKPEASFTLEKTTAQLADGVARRIMPEYMRGLELARAANTRTDAYHDARSRNLRDILGRDLTKQEIKEGKAGHTDLIENVCADISASEDTATLKLHSVPVEVAVKIMKLIRKS